MLEGRPVEGALEGGAILACREAEIRRASAHRSRRTGVYRRLRRGGVGAQIEVELRTSGGIGDLARVEIEPAGAERVGDDDALVSGRVVHPALHYRERKGK